MKLFNSISHFSGDVVTKACIHHEVALHWHVKSPIFWGLDPGRFAVRTDTSIHWCFWVRNLRPLVCSIFSHYYPIWLLLVGVGYFHVSMCPFHPASRPLRTSMAPVSAWCALEPKEIGYFWEKPLRLDGLCFQFTISHPSFQGLHCSPRFE